MKLPLNIDLKDKVVVVTGGGGVLCSMMAQAIAQCGAKVAVLDLKVEAAQVAVDEIVKNGGQAIAVGANVLEKASLEAAHQVVLEKFGPCDILLNGAGGNNPKGTTANEYASVDDVKAPEEGKFNFFNLDPAGVSFVFNLNFIGTLLPTQVFAADMVNKKHGTILNISSMNAFRPLTKIPAYSGAKAAVSNFTQWLAVHMAKVGIRVNAIAPGFFVTNQNRGLLMNADGTWTARANKIIAHTPQGRFGTPEDLLGALLWLLDDEAAGFVTGTVIPIDGGFAAYSGV